MLRKLQHSIKVGFFLVNSIYPSCVLIIETMLFNFLQKSNHKQPSPPLPFSSSFFKDSMAPPSLSSLLSQTQHSAFLSPPPNPNLTHRHTLHRPTISFSTKNENASPKKDSINKIKYPPSPSPSLQTAPTQERKSFAVATGELFLGIASRFIKPQDRKSISSSRDESVSGLSLLERKSNGVGVDEEDKIGAVIKDEVQPEVIWEQRVKDIEAEKERPVITSPGFSFSAAGLLFPYHLGVAQLLIERDYIKETTPLAGSSAGAIVCVVVASGASMQEALTATKVLAENCRLKGTAFRLGAVLREVLEKFLPDDVHIRSNGRVRIGVTQLLWRPRSLLVDQFDSKEDLINAVVTSSFIPGYLAPRPATIFRNRLCIDGGLTLFMPPTSAAQTVRVCAFPASRLGLNGIGISPDLNPENRAGVRELFNWALEPADDTVLDRLFELGYMDAAVWAEENPVEKVVQDGSPLVEDGDAK